MPESSDKMTIEVVRDILREVLEDDPDIFSVDDDGDSDLIVEGIDEAQSRFKIEITAL